MTLNLNNQNREFLNKDEIRTLIKDQKNKSYNYYVCKLWRLDKNQIFYIGKGQKMSKVIKLDFEKRKLKLLNQEKAA